MEETTEKFEFENQQHYSTSDGYQVHLIAVVTYKTGLQIDKMKSVINTSCKNYINSITLLEALDLVGEGPSDLKNNINDKIEISPIISFTIKTIEAVEMEGQISIDIDPELENQGKKDGLLNRIKSKLFGN